MGVSAQTSDPYTYWDFNRSKSYVPPLSLGSPVLLPSLDLSNNLMVQLQTGC